MAKVWHRCDPVSVMSYPCVIFRTMPLSRRTFLITASGLVAAGAIPFGRVLGRPRFATDPFALGVASGCPRPDGIVLWTRLAPEPVAGGGMPPQPIPVAWELAADEAFRTIVRHGTAMATPRFAHSVHVEASGLEAGRWYWYRFHAGKAVSPVGRTRTAPA